MKISSQKLILFNDLRKKYVLRFLVIVALKVKTTLLIIVNSISKTFLSLHHVREMGRVINE